MIRRRPAISLGIGAGAGFVVGKSLLSTGARVSKGTLRSVAIPLVRPTITALGSALATMLVGEPEPKR